MLVWSVTNIHVAWHAVKRNDEGQVQIYSDAVLSSSAMNVGDDGHWFFICLETHPEMNDELPGKNLIPSK